MIKGIFVNVEEGTVTAKECENKLQSFYELIGCSRIEANFRKICGNAVTIICDESGRLKPDTKVSAVNDESYAIYVGNIFIVGFNGVDDFTSLSDEIIEDILNNAVIIIEQNGIQRKILSHIE